MDNVPYVNFQHQTAAVKKDLLEAVSKVLDSGMFILGPEVAAFENEMAKYTSSEAAIGVSNGTDALILSLKALGIGQNDEVITTPNSFIASASAIALVGATPTFCDVGSDLNMCPKALENSITSKTKAIMPVHLTGRPCKMDLINQIAKKNKLAVIEDAAQAIGAKFKGQPVGSLGDIAGFSLHPLKNLRAFGDGGLITTNRSELYDQVIKLRNLGLVDRNTCEVWAGNNRLDEIQAAMLRVNFKMLEEWTKERRRIAFIYNEELKKYVEVPEENSDEYQVYQTYVIQGDRRDALVEHLIKNKVDAKIHYPIQIHNQPAARNLKLSDADFPQSAAIGKRICSLPLYPGLTQQQIEHTINTTRNFYES